MRRSISVVCAGLLVAGCVTTSSGAVGQSPEEVRQILGTMVPTTRLVADARADVLATAARGYMTRAFPLSVADTSPETAPVDGRLAFETDTIEWFADGMPHRTRVRVDVYADGVIPRHRRVEVRASMIEPEYQLADARPGQPLVVLWKLVGSNTKFEELVLEQIMNRYLALVENKPIDTLSEWVVPHGSSKIEAVK